MTNVTRLLEAANRGERRAAAELLPLVYDELRQLAAARMAGEAPGHTLNPTALVHEAYLRLVGPTGGTAWENRGHFFAAASEAMRRVLTDHARARTAAKRGGGRRVTIELDRVAGSDSDDDLLALDESLARLAAVQPEVAKLVTLRYFGGLTVADAAEALGVSARTADSWWAYARAWLAADLARD